MEFGIVGRTTEGFFKYQAWPTVVRGADGTLYAASSGSTTPTGTTSSYPVTGHSESTIHYLGKAST